MRQFYVAVGTKENKLPTLIDLLYAISNSVDTQHTQLVIICNSRDTLDQLVLSLTKFEYACFYLHSDMNMVWRKAVLNAFLSPEQKVQMPKEKPIHNKDFTLEKEDVEVRSKGDGSGSSAQDGKGPLDHMRLLVCTDVCLPQPSLDEPSLQVPLIINYDIPLRKEQHLKRVHCLQGGSHSPYNASPSKISSPAGSSPIHEPDATSKGGAGTIINFIIANEVSLLKSLESFSSRKVEEMPLDLSGILQFSSE